MAGSPLLEHSNKQSKKILFLNARPLSWLAIPTWECVLGRGGGGRDGKGEGDGGGVREAGVDLVTAAALRVRSAAGLTLCLVKQLPMSSVWT